MLRSNLTNKYNPQERTYTIMEQFISSNLTNKYNPQEPFIPSDRITESSNLTNKYNPQEQALKGLLTSVVQILPINTILKNC